MTTAPDIVTAALEYAALGWPVIPLHSPTAGGCSCRRTDCKGPGKHPRTAHGLKDASRAPATIREWWQNWPDANIGIVTGRESSIFVLDVDGEKGRASLAALEAQHGPLPITLTSITGRKDGGEHRWFKYPDGREVRGNTGKLGFGLDVRGAGGFVVVPPSIHRTGRAYEWLNKAPIAVAPPWLMILLASQSLPNGQTRKDGIIRAGERRSTFFRRGCALRGRGLDRDNILATLMQEHPRCEQPPEADHAFAEADVIELVDNICHSFPPGPVRPDAHQPFREFLLAARYKNNLDFITRTKYRTALFDFVRLLKSRAEFAEMDGIQAAERIELELGGMWQEWFADVCDDPRAQFVADWNSARSAAGDDDTLDAAWREAQRYPVTPAHNISEMYCRFLALCARLQLKAGSRNPFIGAQKRFGKLLGCDYTTIGSYIKCAIKDGLLVRVKPCVPHSRAAEYVYSGPGLSPEEFSPEEFSPERPISPERFSPERKTILTRGTEYQDGIGEGASGKNAHPKAAIPETESMTLGYIEGRL